MNRLKSTMLVVFAAVMALSLVLIPNTDTAAQSASLSIPPRKNYVVEPGKTVRDTLVISNIDREAELRLALRVIDFTDNGDGGAPKLLMGEDIPQTTWSLKPFLDVPSSVTIEPGSTKTIDLSVSIPEGEGGGSYYSAIVYSSSEGEGEGNVSLNASGVTLAFVDVPGEADQNLTLEKLGAWHPGGADSGGYRYFNFQMPKYIGYTLNNQGNVTESPVGTIKIKPLFGKEIDISNINPTSALALRGQTRTFTPCIELRNEEVNFQGSRAAATQCVEPGLWPGYYSVELTAFYGRNGNQTHEIIGKASFWYLPWWFILVVMVVLAFVSYHVWKIVRFFKRRKNGGSASPKKQRAKKSTK